MKEREPQWANDKKKQHSERRKIDQTDFMDKALRCYVKFEFY